MLKLTIRSQREVSASTPLPWLWRTSAQKKKLGPALSEVLLRTGGRFYQSDLGRFTVDGHEVILMEKSLQMNDV